MIQHIPVSTHVHTDDLLDGAASLGANAWACTYLHVYTHIIYIYAHIHIYACVRVLYIYISVCMRVYGCVNSSPQIPIHLLQELAFRLKGFLVPENLGVSNWELIRSRG